MRSHAGRAPRDPSPSPLYLPELPPDVLSRIVALLAGDVPTLCAVACLSRAWRAASLAPTLWRSLQLDERGAEALDDAALAALVARAAGGLKRLLLHPKTRAVTVHGVLAALAGSPPLERLAVRGVLCPTAADPHRAATVALLARHVQQPASLDVQQYEPCGALVGGELCGRLCVLGDRVCAACPLSLCLGCAAELRRAHRPQCEHMCACCLRQRGGLRACNSCSAPYQVAQLAYRREHRQGRAVAARAAVKRLLLAYCAKCVHVCAEKGCNVAQCDSCWSGDPEPCAYCGDELCGNCCADEQLSCNNMNCPKGFPSDFVCDPCAEKYVVTCASKACSLIFCAECKDNYMMRDEDEEGNPRGRRRWCEPCFYKRQSR